MDNRRLAIGGSEMLSREAIFRCRSDFLRQSRGMGGGSSPSFQYINPTFRVLGIEITN
jgi:hypothetical protein